MFWRSKLRRKKDYDARDSIYCAFNSNCDYSTSYSSKNSKVFYKFPMPQFLANIIDNPFRRVIRSPKETAIRRGLKKEMTVLEVGPGNGRYIIAVAKGLGSHGRIVIIDIEKKMIDRVIKRVK